MHQITNDSFVIADRLGKRSLTCGIGSIVTVALLQGASAAVLFSDSFSTPGDLNDSAPQVGERWIVPANPAGSVLTVGNGVVTVTGGTTETATAFGSFTQPLSAINPLMVVTFNISAIDTGLTGISLFTGASERFFLGYRNTATSFAVAGNGAGIGNNNNLATGPGQYRFTYDFNTGLTKLYNPAGVEVLSRTATVGLEFDTVRLASGSGRTFAVDSLTVEAIPEPGSAVLGTAGVCLLAFFRRRMK